ncbi:unnamed protein product [Nesidiocoris tenuis]|uniref:Uncharacterized protein n=1 Tax=Nesidiocoris tenuis TaxID=355587 RepID=A0A6H5G389_9HEMI|nr:unnamed protein product [Nesidiocoris tenuis]
MDSFNAEEEEGEFIVNYLDHIKSCSQKVSPDDITLKASFFCYRWPVRYAGSQGVRPLRWNGLISGLPLPDYLLRQPLDSGHFETSSRTLVGRQPRGLTTISIGPPRLLAVNTSKATNRSAPMTTSGCPSGSPLMQERREMMNLAERPQGALWSRTHQMEIQTPPRVIVIGPTLPTKLTPCLHSRSWNKPIHTP